MSSLIDYAGLFPPASLDMMSAVRRYREYLTHEDRWILGKFVVPAARLKEFSAAFNEVCCGEREPIWRLSVLLSGDRASDEEAMEGLKSEFADWIADDVRKLIDARTRYSQTPDADSRAALLRVAHDIKGQAPTFNYPLIARVAGSLSRMIGELPATASIPVALVDAHVNAIQVIHKLAMQDTNDKTAQALCAELDARVDEVLRKK